MRQSFDKSVPEWEQRIRVADAKRKGHKHKSKRRSWKENEKAKNVAKNKLMLRQKFTAKVREFWSGLRDSFPTA